MLYIEPYAGSAPIIHIIDRAKTAVNMNAYFISSKTVLKALAQAHARGVAVRVIIDERPYGMSPIAVQKEVRKVEKTGAMVQAAPPRFQSQHYPYSFDHAKYVCNLHECEIGTANYSYSAFNKNREYIYNTDNTKVVAAALAVFRADWTNTPAGSGPRQSLVLSPGSTNIITDVIDQPGPVYIESEEMGSDPETLAALEKKGNMAHIILPSSISAADQKNCATLSAHGVQIRYMPVSITYMHAKMITGSKYAFIGSENFTATSLDDNREVGLILSNAKDLSELKGQFRQDWSQARPASS